MPEDQVAQLNDWFGNFLRTTPHEQRPYTFRDLLTKTLPERSWIPFAVCDGISIPYDPTGERLTADGSTKLNAVPRHLRFIVVCTPTDPEPDSHLPVRTRIGRFRDRGGMCIVGSAEPDSRSRFLQVVSWQHDALRPRHGYFRYYEVCPQLSVSATRSDYCFSDRIDQPDFAPDKPSGCSSGVHWMQYVAT